MIATAADDLDALRPPPDRVAEIRAAIAAYNADRPGRFLRHIVLAWGGTGLFAVGVVLLAIEAWKVDHGGQGLLVILIGGAVLTVSVWHLLETPMRNFQQTLRGRILPVAFGFVERLSYQYRPHSCRATDLLGKTGLLPFSRRAISDDISGRHQDMDFQLVAGQLISVQTTGSGANREENREVIFEGLILLLSRDRPFPGRLHVATRPNAVARVLRDLFTSRLTVIVRYEGSRHEYRTDNVAAAEALIGATLDRAVGWLERTWGQGPAQLILSDRDVFLLLPTEQPWFALPGIDQDLDYEQHVEPMIWDLVRLLAVAKLVRQV